MKGILFTFITTFLSFHFLNSNAFTVQGLAKLGSASNHSGILVSFIPMSQSAQAVSGLTLADGSFSLFVLSGVYDIKYSKSGYQELLITNQFINSDVTLNQVTLSSKPIISVNGNVQGNWLSSNTYSVDGDISIPAGQELIIEKGTTVQFSGFYKLTVQGKLTAIGTEQERITFTPSKAIKARGDWAGIFVNTSSDTTRFRYCVIEYAASKVAETAIINNTGNLKIDKSVIRGSSYGGVSNRFGGFMRIENSEVTDTYFFAILSSVSATGCLILNNKVHHIDLIGISCQWSVSLLKGNEVFNTGYTAIQSYGNMTIEYNVLYNNPYGVFVVSDKPTIRNNTIYKNGHGIGFYDSDFWHPSAIVSNNIIFQNNGYGIYCEGVYSPEKVEYNLISGNPSGVANRGPIGLGVKVTTNSNGHQADTYLNIFDNPIVFSIDNLSEYFLRLMPTSPAINSGDPNYRDLDGSVVDCGAYPFQGKDQTITFQEIPSKTFGDVDFVLAATASSGLPVTFVSANPSVAIITGNVVRIVGAGTANIVAKQGGHPNFKEAPEVSREMIVKKADQIINFPAIFLKKFGDAPFNLSATSTSGLPVSYTSSDETVATILGSTVTIKGAGITTFFAKQSGNSNYNAATDVSQLLTVDKADQSITFLAIASNTLGNPSFVLVASSTSGLTVNFSTATDKVSIVENQLVMIKPGTVEIMASQGGNSNFKPAPSALRSFCINPPKPSTSLSDSNSGLMLVSNASLGNQWYLNSTTIPNATSNTYKPTASGIYSVRVTIDNCASEFSADQTLVITGLENPNLKSGFSVYPNPVDNTLKIDLSKLKDNEKIDVAIFDLAGKEVSQVSTNRAEEITISVANYLQGLYFIKVTQLNYVHGMKIYKR